MSRSLITLSSFAPAALAVLAALALASCAGSPRPTAFQGQKAAWRDTSEKACLTSGQVRPTSFVTPMQGLGGPGVCGALKPFKMSAADFGRVKLRPAAVLRCTMVTAVDAWVSEGISPLAARHLGSPVVALKVAASYSCRTRNGLPGAKLSEHGLANALDVSAFYLADGRQITVKRGWRGTSAERRFLREVHASACRTFTTVLGPEADRFHHDHFHVDLAKHGRKGTYRVCR